ncbi:MAG: hypothetical protein P8Z78_01545 [Gammaproteobacteria bacterium]
MTLLNIPLISILAFCLALGVPVYASSLDPDEAWFEADEAVVNTGDLHFLPRPVDSSVLHSLSRIEISPESLGSGWVSLRQCYYNLDRVPRVEVVYNYNEMRDLAVIGTRGIGKAEVKGQGVELEDVSKKASICVAARIRNFYAQPDGGYVLKNGPYMRRFLDGYFPFRVSLEVIYPQELLRFDSIAPAAQQGFSVETGSGRLAFDAWFEGRLETRIGFTAVD